MLLSVWIFTVLVTRKLGNKKTAFKYLSYDHKLTKNVRLSNCAVQTDPLYWRLNKSLITTQVLTSEWESDKLLVVEHDTDLPSPLSCTTEIREMVKIKRN